MEVQMKKIIIVFALAAILATGTAFADHPDGWGVGIVGGYYGGWEGGGYPHFGLSLKVPDLPIFWGINLNISSYYFGLGVTGDYYFIDKILAPDINLHWFLGVGGWVNLGIWNTGNKDGGVAFGLGARVPIGLSWQLDLGGSPLTFLEIFLDVAPSLGVYIAPGFHFPAGGWPIEFGLRLWF